VAGGVRSNADFAIVAALAGGATVVEAAKRAKVAERTVYRRLEDPTFRQHVTDARSEMVSQAVGGLAQAMSAASMTLTLLLAPTVAPSVRLGAARAILELGSKLRESEELEQRLAVVEEALAEGRLRRVS
jgi:hypothetical protein